LQHRTRDAHHETGIRARGRQECRRAARRRRRDRVRAGGGGHDLLLHPEGGLKRKKE